MIQIIVRLSASVRFGGSRNRVLLCENLGRGILFAPRSRLRNRRRVQLLAERTHAIDHVVKQLGDFTNLRRRLRKIHAQQLQPESRGGKPRTDFVMQSLSGARKFIRWTRHRSAFALQRALRRFDDIARPQSVLVEQRIRRTRFGVGVFNSHELHRRRTGRGDCLRHAHPEP
jgi:hypothetical protein